MLSFFKKDKNKPQEQNAEAVKAEDQFVELKGKQSDKDEAKKKSSVCCGSCGGSGH
ncbi:MAG: hypothetical protein OQK12_04175 [Motiliproteus sp.]|nr:hypothetical protein [Motiliproteus sp.]MCW9053352.1 hypothetical protein [Motiliproteus sp.]